MTEPITTRMPNWVAAIIALIILSVMGGSAYWIYLDYSTPPKLEHAGAIAPSAEGEATQTFEASAEPSPSAAAPSPPRVSTQQITQLDALTLVKAEEYAADNGVFRFRSASANEVCAFADDINKLRNDRWVRLAPTGDQGELSGPGLACSMVQGPRMPRKDDRRACNGAPLTGRSATLTGGFVGYGACHEGHNPVLTDARTDSNNRERIPERISGVKEVPNGSAIELGNRFKCGGLLPNLTCVDLQTGRGFGISAGEYVLYPPAK